MMPIFPSISKARRSAAPNLPSAEQLLKNRLIINRIKREQKQQPQKSQNTPEVHYEPKEGVYYQFNEEHQPKKCLMGFREWCEKVWDKRKAPPVVS
jgi:hypothetical protein